MTERRNNSLIQLLFPTTHYDKEKVLLVEESKLTMIGEILNRIDISSDESAKHSKLEVLDVLKQQSISELKTLIGTKASCNSHIEVVKYFVENGFKINRLS